jgi:hypothetical protein
MTRARHRKPTSPGPAPRRGILFAKKSKTAEPQEPEQENMPKLSASSMLLLRLGRIVRNLEQYRPIRAEPWPRA